MGWPQAGSKFHRIEGARLIYTGRESMNRLRFFSVVVLSLVTQLGASQSVPPSATARSEAEPNPAALAVWQAHVQSNPDNLEARGNLLAYYKNHGPVEEFFGQALWIVQHHPESSYAVLAANSRPVAEAFTDPDYALLKSAWEQALIDQADNGKVRYHAGLFFTLKDPIRAVDEFERARQLDPENRAILQSESSLYARAFTRQSPRSWSILNPTEIQTLQGEIGRSTDPALLAEVGSDLIRFGQSSSDTSLKPKGTELINKAISLDPTNEKWKAAAERATLTAPQQSPSGSDPTGAVRVGGRVAEANLLRKVDPVYPSDLIRARVSGVVEFTALIGEDGHIQNLQLVRGHPLFVNPAKEAVLQYVYKPTLLNGSPVRVITSITVPFQVPAQ